MARDHETEHASRSAAILWISQEFGFSRDSLRIWMKQHVTDTGKREPDRASGRAKRDADLRADMNDVWTKNRPVYGACNLWHAMRREGFDVARCTMERLMRQLGIKGVRRGKKIRTTHGQPLDHCPLDKVNREFRASMPNELWVSDFIFVSTWRGFVYVAFVIDTFANRIVAWKASVTQDTQFLLDALEQAIGARKPAASVAGSISSQGNSPALSAQLGVIRCIVGFAASFLSASVVTGLLFLNH